MKRSNLGWLVGLWVMMVCATVSAAIDDSAYWPVEVSSAWNSVYGTVSGISLQNGDSVGMFDTEGNCYGAGLFNGNRYYLSAFAWEEKDHAIPGDFAIPGFKDGDKVMFKVYQQASGREYLVNLASDDSYVYEYEGKYPPIRLDLVYEEEVGPWPEEPEPEEPGPEEPELEPEPEPEPEPEEGSTGGYWRVGAAVGTEEESAAAERTVSRGEEKTESYEEYEPYEQGPSGQGREYAAREARGKEAVTKKASSARPLKTKEPLSIEQQIKQAVKALTKESPILTKIFLAALGLFALILLVKKLWRKK